ncbi:hypothetical protein MBRA_02887 [Methylobacterium brachiatum]|nr:hypothetical protein MBRA_02887 [Methylobacterium brachiatum]
MGARSCTVALPLSRRAPRGTLPAEGGGLKRPYRIVGMENSAPLLMPLGQRCVTVLVLV